MEVLTFHIAPAQAIYQTVSDYLAPFFKDHATLFNAKSCQEIHLCLVEAIQNARIHSGKPQSVRCQLSLGSRELTLKIWDHNPAFVINEPLQLPDDPYAERGRGLFIIGQLVDRLQVERYPDGNCLILTKGLPKAEKTEKTESAISSEDPLNLLYEISESIVQANEVNFDRIYQLVLDKAIEVFGVERASIMNYDPASGVLEIVASRGLPGDVVKATHVRPGEGVSGWVFKEAKPILIHGNERHLEDESGYKSQSFISAPMLCSPMRMGKACIGVINITERRDGRPFEEKDLRLLTTLANQAAAYVRIGHLIEQVKDSQRMEQELGWALKIQRSLLPQQVLTTERVEAYGYCEMARQVGGDYFDYIHQGRYLYLVIADVSGHNLPAALTMVNFRSLLRSHTSQAERPQHILERINELIYDDLAAGEQQITTAIMRLDFDTQTLLYANAGHHPVFYLARHSQKVESLYGDGILLGAVAQARFEEEERAWQPMDRLLFYTDGVIEAGNQAGEAFGRERLQRLFVKYRQLSPAIIAQLILKEAHGHIGNRAIEDDLTLMPVTLK